MKRRELLEKAGPVAAGAALLAVPGRVVATASPVAPPKREPKASCWVNGQRVGEVVAVTSSVVRAEQASTGYLQRVSAAGTLILLEPDWELLEGEQPLMGEARKVEVRVQIPFGVRRPGGPREIRLEGCQLLNHGFGWSEDDLTEELALQWIADNLRLEGRL